MQTIIIKIKTNFMKYQDKFDTYKFVFSELVKRDFKKKYKRTVLGMAWSVLSPLLMLLVMSLVFTHFFGRNTPHYNSYLFAGYLVYKYFSEATSQGMSAFVGNAHIFTKVTVPKYLFLFSRNMQELINFALNMVVFFIFCVFDHIRFSWHFIALIYPISMLFIFNTGVSLILACIYVFFKDTKYLWTVALRLILYMSAIYYRVDSYPEKVQRLFLMNPVFVYGKYIRVIVIDNSYVGLRYMGLCAFYAFLALGLGVFLYRKTNTKFLYYL